MTYPKTPWNELLRELGAFVILVASIVLLWRDNLLLSIVVFVEGLVVLASWHDRHDISFFLVIGLLGSLTEAVFVHFGVWRYANPIYLGIPPWFPLAFGTTGLIGQRLARTIADIWEKTGPSRTTEE